MHHCLKIATVLVTCCAVHGAKADVTLVNRSTPDNGHSLALNVQVEGVTLAPGASYVMKSPSSTTYTAIPYKCVEKGGKVISTNRSEPRANPGRYKINCSYRSTSVLPDK